MTAAGKLTPDDVEQWLAEHGDMLFCFALKRVGDQTAAEDLVQETFLAALKAQDGFEGRSQVRTWLVGILKNKIVDHFRRAHRKREVTAESDSELDGQLFDQGVWREGVRAWPNPSQQLENAEFLQAVALCREKLPRTLSDAFRLRDLEQLPMADICEALGISSSNLSVRLHRARLLLRDCLQRTWFVTGGQSS